MNRILHSVFTAKFSRYFLPILFFFNSSFSFAQIRFSASVNDKIISKNDYLQIQFTVENAGTVDGILPPAFKNFTVVSGPNQQSSMSNINGNIKQSISIGYVLKPLATGNFTIGSAVAKVDGKEYHSSPLNIAITNSASSNRAGGNSLSSPFANMTLDFAQEPATHQFDDYILKKRENVAEKIKKNLFIRIDVNKTSCYVGEPIVATYKLYTRLKSESNVLKTPSFNGFSVNELEMPDNYSLKTEKYLGREYNVYTLRKVQLYPLQSGILSLDPVEVKNTINFLKAEYADSRNGDIFYEMLRNFANETAPGEATEQQTATISCTPVNINVKPLPEESKPADFKGAVGKFKINASLEKNNITTDDAGSLKIIIEGAGNIEMINAPNVTWAKGLEGFEPKSLEHIDKFSVPIKGEKIFTYPFTIEKADDYTIPSISFSFFDITAKSYKTLSTQPLQLHVVKGSGNLKKAGNSNFTPGVNAENNFFYNYRWYVAAAIVFVLIGIFLFVKNTRKSEKLLVKDFTEKNVTETKIDEAIPFVIPKNALWDAEEKLLKSDAGFYKALDVSLHTYLSEKLNVPAELLSKKKINERMDKCEVSVRTTLLVNTLLEEIELNLYAPTLSTTQMKDVYEKASEVVSLLNKQVC